MYKFLTTVMSVLVTLAVTTPAAAQTVTDATTAEFVPSAEHNATTVDGTPLVSSYLLQIFPLGSSTPSHSLNLGKPSPDPDGLIRAEFVSRLSTPLLAGVTYEARVSSVGPGGTSPSQVSNAFTGPTCTLSLSAASTSIAAGASTGSVTVSTAANCAWTASSNHSWLTVTSLSPVLGTGIVNFSAAANTSTTARIGTLTVAGQTFTVNQSGASPPCPYTINPGSKTVGAAGETTVVTVTAANGCDWTATSPVQWIVVASGAQGSGNGSVTLNVAANTATTQRTATVTIAGRPFNVTQAGACAYTVTPATLTVAAAGVASTFTIGTTTGCSWGASGMPSWITIPTGTQTGPGTLTYTVASNQGAARSASLTVAGTTVLVNQAASAAPPPPANLRVVGVGSQ